MSMQKIYYKPSKTEPLTELSAPEKGCWIRLDNTNAADLAALAKLAHIDEIDLVECLDKYELPRVERSNSTLLIFTRYPTDQEAGLYTATFTLILTQEYCITVCPH